ncbi:MAG TPA: PQQ-binding-like beta-propeller repeat protein, partial [Acidobacteriaceae bacterium]|nr:PQQ-binding-like beta-propeller repeat protein [Acidobacteriaceae bacterium]
CSKLGLIAACVALLLPGSLRTLTVHAASGESKAHTTWQDYEGGSDSAQYSALKQINRSNVNQLQQVWFYPAGNNGFRFGFNPIVVDGVMYVVGKDNSTVALDAATGKEIWVHDNGSPRLITNRGINYWESRDRSDRRLFYSTNNTLHALDARNGKPIDSFGDHGNIDLREGLGRDPKTIRQIESGSPGRVFENLLILGSATGEEYGSPPGDIRAFDVHTGKMVWIFHTVPHPGEFGYDTWPKNAWKYVGGTNDWGGMTIDEKRGIAYFSLGSPTYDFYGADRIGADLFGNCLLALDARTGKYLWHFQAVHHDLWDYDLATAPKLLTVSHDGEKVDIVAVAGKNGFLYVFDRVTGKPIWPIEERPVPKSDMPGEQAWPTQPFPTAPPPFATQKFTADDVDPYIADPAERAKVREELLAARNEGLFTPPSTTNTVEMPGNNGGANWGAGATDPATGTLYIQSKNGPSMLKLETKPPKRQMTGSPATQGKVLYIQNCQSCHLADLAGQPPSIPALQGIVPRIGADHVKSTIRNGAPPMPAFTDLSSKEVDALVAYLSDPASAKVPPDVLAFLSAPRPPPPPAENGAAPVRYWTGYGYMNSTDGLPANKPLWSSLTAYDLNQGTIKWQIPLGGVTDLADKGIKDTGSYWPRGGVVVTAGGLIFSGTISDSTIRAYDKDTGKVLWEKVMPAGPEGIPAVFEVHGKEYLAFSARPSTILAGAGGRRPSRAAAAEGSLAPATQGYYVFALPGTVKKGKQ